MNDGSTTQPADVQPPSGDKIFILSILVGALLIGGLFGWATWAKRTDEMKSASTPPLRYAEQSLFQTPFRLVERSGLPVSSSELKGRFLVVNLVWTSCSLTCLQVNQQMERIQAMTEGQDDVQLVSISVDPEEDTPAALTRFAQQFRADTKRWLFLTGDKSAVGQIAEGIFGRDEFANLEKEVEHGAPGQGSSKAPSLLMNTGRIALLDKEGMLRTSFSGLKGTTPDAILKALSGLRRELALQK